MYNIYVQFFILKHGVEGLSSPTHLHTSPHACIRDRSSLAERPQPPRVQLLFDGWMDRRIDSEQGGVVLSDSREEGQFSEDTPCASPSSSDSSSLSVSVCAAGADRSSSSSSSSSGDGGGEQRLAVRDEKKTCELIHTSRRLRHPPHPAMHYAMIHRPSPKPGRAAHVIRYGPIFVYIDPDRLYSHSHLFRSLPFFPLLPKKKKRAVAFSSKGPSLAFAHATREGTGKIRSSRHGWKMRKR